MYKTPYQDKKCTDADSLMKLTTGAQFYPNQSSSYQMNQRTTQEKPAFDKHVVHFS